MSIEIVEVPVPERWDDESEGARLLRDYVDVRNGVYADLFGDDSHAFSHRQAWAQWRSQRGVEESYRPLALLDGVPAGRGYAGRSLLEAQTIAEVDVLVLPGARGRGVGTALAEAMLERMRAQGVTTFQAWVAHFPAGGPVLTAPTGFGEIAADTPAVRMLQRYGFALEQVERMSELRLADAAPALAAHRHQAEARALPGYRLEAWEGRSAPERLDGLAALHARMSTDAPAAGLDHEAEQWDAARLAKYEDAQVEGGRTLLRAIAVEEATDAPVAFTTLVSAGTSGSWYQHDTLVHGDHRGHRLGMLVKAANLQALRALDPAAVVRTWNAAENVHMLAVNEALGFRRLVDEGAWQRKERP
ncbi:GNAT family N-acetyltransferase [Agrococcus baldri]|uniref:GNAT family N-acetyltransferase n=1 Tax=Agrococcus baldri TaxID=153730 RepID=A0AA87RFP1_9MICO|nr:GNAT family N-acetyltransferase [Agrococcus baldri]GEK78788.1 GNAT family N-acetyltransferase [Agrococcus baldri]